jgi:hypothetical protein
LLVLKICDEQSDEQVMNQTLVERHKRVYGNMKIIM